MRKPNDAIASEAVIYAFSHVETWLQDYAHSHRLPSYELTVRVATLLQSQAGGQILGLENRMPTLRRAPTKVHKAARSLAMAKRAHRKTQIKKSAQAAYWAKLSPLQRSREMKRRMTLWSPAAKERWKGRAA